MHRPLTVRALSLVLSLWLPLFMGGAEWAVRCPMHGGVHSGAAQHAAGDDHSDHAGAAGQHSAPADHGAGKHNCSCPGPGCCPTAVAVVPAVTVPMAHVALVHEARAVSALDLFSGDRDYLLPFATAPPAAALAPAASIIA
ncbi:MAG TPA: hypothetical protein VL308_17325 [Gemmatimonadaceae bacterium]|jgi:hypothetical protein|nr:hypothetical protein [Gemmatimonadaceae bacterium]